jgi:hypothetical protein
MEKTDYNEVQLEIELNDGLQTWGTCDRLTIYNNTKALLADYKTGISQIDPPEKNQQAIAYTLGVFQKYPDVEEVTFVFYIPQYNDTPHHTFKRSDVDWMRAKLTDIVRNATRVRPMWNGGTPPIEELRPTPNCRFCRYEDSCPALGGLVLGVAKKLNPDLPDVDYDSTEDPEAIEFLYNIAKIVGNWAERHRKRSVELAKEGMVLPTLRLRSMGATSSVQDNAEFIRRAVEYGADEAEIMQAANLPVGKIADLVAATAGKGEKSRKKEIFLEECLELAIVEKSEIRYTLA